MSSTPPDIFATSLSNERSLLDGTVIGGVAYGVLFTLACQCLHLLLFYPRNKKIQWHLVAYVVTLFALSTAAFGTEVKYNELTFVDNRNYPGGPVAFNFDHYNNPVNVATFATSFVATWFADAFLTYRLFVFSQRKWLVLIGPFIILAASIVVSVILLNQIANPTASFWAFSAVQFGTAFWALTTSLNMLVTGSILGRIWLFRRSIRKEFKTLGVQKVSLSSTLSSPPSSSSSGGDRNGAFGGTIAILLESAALSLVIGVFFLVVYVRGSIVMNVMMPVQGQIVVIAPLLIVLRVAQGSAWTQETAASVSLMVFESRTTAAAAVGRRRPRRSGSICDTLDSFEGQGMCEFEWGSGTTLARLDDRNSDGVEGRVLTAEPAACSVHRDAV